jgi:hypothetical protein
LLLNFVTKNLIILFGCGDVGERRVRLESVPPEAEFI